jgi:hypothetical protein
MSWTNALTAFTERVAMPGAWSARRRASMKEIRSRSARAAAAPSARSPIPRLGSLTMRRTLMSSAGFTMARR